MRAEPLAPRIHRLTALALAVVGLGLGLAKLRSYVLLHDEGLVLQAAARMADGDWPYRDFWWNYGPGQPALLAALQPLSDGPSLLVWRLVRAATDSGTAVCVFVLARRHVAAGWALAAWAATLLLLLVARLPHPNATVALLALLAVALARDRPRAAGAIVGVALWFRPEIAVFVAAAAVLAAAPARRRAVAGLAAAVGVVLWLPFVLAAGPGPVLDQTAGFDLRVQRLQRLPLRVAPPDGVRAGSLDHLHVLLPVLVLLSALGAAVAVAIRWRRGTASRELVAMLPLLAGGSAYLLGRADGFHLVSIASVLPLTLALLVTAQPAATRAPSCAAPLRLGRRRPSRGSLAAVACAGLLGLLILDGATRRADVVRLDGAGLVPAPGPAADGVRMGREDAAALAAIRVELDRRTGRGTPVWVANARHDRITSGATLAYLLLDRPSATRYDIMQPGVVTRADVQREIAGMLARTGRPVVQWLDPTGAAREDNAAGRESGARVLDGFLRRTYRPVAQRGRWRLLVPRGAG